MLIRFPDRTEDLVTVPNTGAEVIFAQARENLRRGLPELDFKQQRPEPAIICGGGPSLTDEAQLATIRKLKELGGVLIALNNSGKTLLQHGLRPDYQIVLDARGQNVDFVREDTADRLLLASQVHPSVVDAALERGADVTLFTHGTQEYGEALAKELGREKSPHMVGGSHTVGLVAMCVAFVLGHDIQHLFGYDSSHRDDKGHAYPQPMNASDELLHVVVDDGEGGKMFTGSIAMVSQARAFPALSQHLADLGCEFHVHGDGLLPTIAGMVQRGQETKTLTAIYDLATAPATWEFLTFLCEAERFRVDHGCTCIDIVLSPGPLGGFRMDFLPPPAEERAGMLQRVILPATRLLPTVRNVILLRDKSEYKPEGTLFPPMWTPEYAVSCYGPEHLVDGNRVLRSTSIAKKWREDNYPGPYVTITLREAEYWPGRNSNRMAWKEVAAWLEERGHRVIFVPDTYGKPIPGWETCDVAAWDIDLRLALYEGAQMNLGVSNGPMSMCYLSEAPYRIFKLLPEDGSPITEAFYKRRGIEIGGQWSTNGRNVWEQDTTENIIRELEAWMESKQELEAA